MGSGLTARRCKVIRHVGENTTKKFSSPGPPGVTLLEQTGEHGELKDRKIPYAVNNCSSLMSLALQNKCGRTLITYLEETSSLNASTQVTETKKSRFICKRASELDKNGENNPWKSGTRGTRDKQKSSILTQKGKTRERKAGEEEA